MTQEKYFGIKPYGATPSERQLEHLKIGKKAFFHFGPNTFTGKEWGDGTEREELFNPTAADVRSWIRNVKEAGFEFAILTAKHHDGFCLWPSRHTEHSVKNSPYKNGKGDIVKEFTDACREFNVKVGIYISPWDRNSKFWGTDEYSLQFANQLEELLAGYGRIDEVWWDGAGSSETKYDWGFWAYLVKKHQPQAVIFGSPGASYAEIRWVGNEGGFAGKTHYASIDEADLGDRNALNRGKQGADHYLPAEVDVSIRPGWFYHEDQDGMVKSSRKLDEIWFRSVGNNAIMLLNFPPDKSGNLVATDVKNAKESHFRIQKMLHSNSLEGAAVTADSQYCLESGICKARFSDDSLFYATAPDKAEAVIEITLPENSFPNVLILGEKVELGERINAFTLETMDNDTPKLLCEGTSVGYLRALTFESGNYRKLRLTIKGAKAPLTLRTLSLNCYDEDTSPEALYLKRKNLATLKTAQIEISPDNKSAKIMFGGIFPFSTVCFNVYWSGGSYKISAFDGEKFYTVAEGVAIDRFVRVDFDSPIETAYQIKIESSNPLSQEPDFKVI